MRHFLTFSLVTFVVAVAGCGDSAAPPAAKAPATPAAPSAMKEKMDAAKSTAAETATAVKEEAAAAAAPTNRKCPVAGEDVDPTDPKLARVEYKGQSYVVCCKDCVAEFKADPEKYVSKLK